ncbi:MAG: hypothetical protein A4S16_07820 [Proteobacteria bacterium SG_bin6]|nr:MAG: hypothetical protein A4S16_07820 [Proteobacteria bacterium SG_bin6]
MLLAALDACAREALLFAAAGFVIGGIDDLLIDLLFAWRALRRKLRAGPRFSAADFALAKTPGRMAVFVPAWDEGAVIAPMLTALLARYDYPDYTVYVGAYPNDRATIDAVNAIVKQDARVRLVIGPREGPTTKADCLNTLWQAMLEHEATCGRVKAVVLHDAEDLVHPAELRIFDWLIGRHAAVQLPVLPLIHPQGRVISAVYSDEFAESHAKQLQVREALGAGLPLAGVGCALDREVLARVGGADGPFDRASLTEDYELGLAIAAAGGSTIFVHVRETPGSWTPVAVRAYFPHRIDAAVRQRARWMVGIALAGWDRLGWGRPLAWRDHWMRLRDRRAPLAVLVLAAAYTGLLLWGTGAIAHAIAGTPQIALLPDPLLIATGAMMLWRLAVRVGFTTVTYGWREGIAAIPRVIIGNYIALLAARRALTTYVGLLRGHPLAWDKTAHHFPQESA